MKRLILAGTVFLMITSVQGQSWKRYYDSTYLYWSTDWKKTVLYLEEAEKDVRHQLPPDHDEYLMVTTDLAVAYWNINDYQNAGRLLSTSFSTRPEYYSAQHQTELLKTIHGLASWYLENGNIQHSKFYYSAITKNKLNATESVLYYTAAMNLISLYENSNAPDSALYVWNLVTNHHPGNLHEDLAWMLTYSRIQEKTGQVDEALKTLEQLKLQHSADRRTNRRSYADILTLMGQIYFRTNDYFKSINCFREAAGILEEGSILTAKVVELKEAIALAYQLAGKPKRSVRYLDEIIPLIAKENGVQSHRYAKIYFDYGESLYAAEKYRQAILVYENSLLLLQKHIPENDLIFITLLKNLAASYTQIHDQHYAYVYLRWAYEMLDRNSINHQVLAREVMKGLADVYQSKGDDTSAAAFHLEADQLGTTLN